MSPRPCHLPLATVLPGGRPGTTPCVLAEGHAGRCRAHHLEVGEGR